MNEEESFERKYALLVEGTQQFAKGYAISFLDGLVEMMSTIRRKDGEILNAEDELNDETLAKISENVQEFLQLGCDEEEAGKLYQLCLIKGMKEDKLHQNYQMTPEAINVLFAYLAETLVTKETVRILDGACGTGSLVMYVAKTLAKNGRKIEGVASDDDDLMGNLVNIYNGFTKAGLKVYQRDAVTSAYEQQFDVVLGDLPIGFYPEDEVAKSYEVYEPSEHTYAHHLIVEQMMKQVDEDGYGLFLLPQNLFTSDQGDNFVKYMKKNLYLQAVLELPEKLFQNKAAKKNLFVFQKISPQTRQKPVFAYYLSDLKDKEVVLKFMEELRDWL